VITKESKILSLGHFFLPENAFEENLMKIHSALPLLWTFPKEGMSHGNMTAKHQTCRSQSQSMAIRSLLRVVFGL